MHMLNGILSCLALWLRQVEALRAELDAKCADVETLRASTASELYRADLDAFLVALAEVEAAEATDATLLGKQRRKAAGKQPAKGKVSFES